MFCLFSILNLIYHFENKLSTGTDTDAIQCNTELCEPSTLEISASSLLGSLMPAASSILEIFSTTRSKLMQRDRLIKDVRVLVICVALKNSSDRVPSSALIVWTYNRSM